MGSEYQENVKGYISDTFWSDIVPIDAVTVVGMD
jgi:hypothetical protein